MTDFNDGTGTVLTTNDIKWCIQERLTREETLVQYKRYLFVEEIGEQYGRLVRNTKRNREALDKTGEVYYSTTNWETSLMPHIHITTMEGNADRGFAIDLHDLEEQDA